MNLYDFDKTINKTNNQEKIIENIDYLKRRINNTQEENQLYQIINNIILEIISRFLF